MTVSLSTSFSSCYNQGPNAAVAEGYNSPEVEELLWLTWVISQEHGIR